MPAGKKPEVDLVAPQISVQDFTAAVFAGVIRAIEAQKPQLPRKIIYGIILDPSEHVTVTPPESTSNT